MSQYPLHEDGTLRLGRKSLRLTGLRLTLDGVPVAPLHITTDGRTRVTFALARSRSASLETHIHGSDLLDVQITLREFDRLPFRVALVGEVAGGRRAFVQGLGFSGPSGFVPLSSPDRLYSRENRLYSRESYLVAGVEGDGVALTVYATDHRRFLQQTSFRNRTNRRGLVNRHLESEQVFCEVALLPENTLGGSEVVLPTLRFRWSPTLAGGLDGAARDIAASMDVPLNKPARWHYCSWYRRHSHYSLSDLRAFLAQHTASGLHLQTAQIDDGYQTAPGDWLSPNERGPGGLPNAFDEIRRHGLTPGIWVAPFMVGNRSQLYRDHPDFVVRTRDGQPWTEWRHYDGTHAHEEHYCLDASHPAVVEHLHHTFRQLRDWAAGLFKTHFLDWGLKDTTHALRHNPHLTSIEAYRNVMAAIRHAIGPDSYWLACIAPYAPMLGFADGIRIANDVGTQWSDGSHGNLLAESQHTYRFHRVLFENDPDALYLRQIFNQLSDREIRAVASWVGVLGLSVNSSEFPDEVQPSRMALWKWLRPEAHPPKARLPWWGKRRDLLAAIRSYPQSCGGFAIAILNPGKEAICTAIPDADWTTRLPCTLFRWTETGTTPLGVQEMFHVELSPHEALVLYASPDGSPPTTGLTLGGYIDSN